MLGELVFVDYYTTEKFKEVYWGHSKYMLFESVATSNDGKISWKLIELIAYVV